MQERKEHKFRIKQERVLVKEINESNERDLAALKTEHKERSRGELQILSSTDVLLWEAVAGKTFTLNDALALAHVGVQAAAQH